MYKKILIKHALIQKISLSCKVSLITASIFLSSISSANSNQPKASYYRYYDARGAVTISRNVSPEHVRRGYEVLDRNMFLIRKVPAYNVEQDLTQENKRAAQHKQAQRDSQIQRSFRNVDYATEKKTDALKFIQKQLGEQYLYMKQLQVDHLALSKQKTDLVFNKKAIPPALQKKLDDNEESIKQTRTSIELLKNQLIQQEIIYDEIINRLQKMQ